MEWLWNSKHTNFIAAVEAGCHICAQERPHRGCCEHERRLGQAVQTQTSFDVQS